MKAVEGIKPPPNKTVVKQLESLLAQAKEGRIQMFAGGYTCATGETGLCYAGCNYPIALIGQLRVLEVELIKEYVELLDRPVDQ